jgi:hypothetical protein
MLEVKKEDPGFGFQRLILSKVKEEDFENLYFKHI